MGLPLSLRNLDLERFLDVLYHLVDLGGSLLELPNTLAQGSADLGEFTHAEDDYDYYQDYQYLG